MTHSVTAVTMPIIEANMVTQWTSVQKYTAPMGKIQMHRKQTVVLKAICKIAKEQNDQVLWREKKNLILRFTPKQT